MSSKQQELSHLIQSNLVYMVVKFKQHTTNKKTQNTYMRKEHQYEIPEGFQGLFLLN